MKNLVFKYSRWYSRSARICHALMPICALIMSGIFKNISSPTVRYSIAIAFLVLLMITGSIYTNICFKRNRSIKYLYPNNLTKDKLGQNHFDTMALGLILMLITCMMFFGVIPYYIIKGAAPAWPGCLLAGLSLVTSIVSNMALHVFEAENYSKIFTKRHADTDIKEVMESLPVAPQTK